MRLDTHPPTMATAVALYRRFGFRDIEAAPLRQSSELAYMELVFTGVTNPETRPCDLNNPMKAGL
jgi:hypothetical protein